MKFPLIGQAYTNRSSSVSAQECINLYYEKVESDGRSDAVLHGTPGLQAFATPGNGPIRGMHVMDGIMYVVSGSELYSVNAIGASVRLGVITGLAVVSMESNNKEETADDGLVQQLCIVNGVDGYIYDITNGLVKIIDNDFEQADVVGYVDTYFIFNWTNTNKFFISNLSNGTVYTATDIGRKNTAPDNIVTLIVDHKEVWVFGEETIEVWYNQAGSAGFPFVEIESAFIEHGCAAVHSPEKIDNTIFWLGDDLVIYMAQGYNPIRISTHAIEYAIKQYSSYSDAFSFTYTDEGHKFYVLTFPAGSTWVYDVANGAWHERKSLGLDRWRANAYTYFNNKHYVGDYATNDVYEMSMDVYTEDGTAIQRTRATTYVHAESEPVFMDWLQISGAGITTGQGSDPQAMLQYSDDGGYTWSNEKWRSMGKIGQYFKRVRWTQLGRFYQRVFRIVVSDPIKVVLTEADISLTVGKR